MSEFIPNSYTPMPQVTSGYLEVNYRFLSNHNFVGLLHTLTVFALLISSFLIVSNPAALAELLDNSLDEVYFLAYYYHFFLDT